MKKYLLIINPRAGRSKTIESDLVDFFGNNKIKLVVKKTKRPLDARRFARQANNEYPVVVVAGGDGTINEAVNGLANSRTKMGVIPLGTENALACWLGIPSNHLDAAEVIVRGKSRTFDLGVANNRHFILTCGIGLDAKSISDIRPFIKKVLGRSVYPLSGIKNVLTHIPSKLEIKLDDQVLPRIGYFVVVGNAKYYGCSIDIAKYAKPDDGYLDVCIFKRTDVVNMFKYFVSVKSGLPTPLSEMVGIEYFRVKKIRITSKKPALVHTDAEIIGTTPVNINVCPKAIRLIC